MQCRVSFGVPSPPSFIHWTSFPVLLPLVSPPTVLFPNQQTRTTTDFSEWLMPRNVPAERHKQQNNVGEQRRSVLSWMHCAGWLWWWHCCLPTFWMFVVRDFHRKNFNWVFQGRTALHAVCPASGCFDFLRNKNATELLLKFSRSWRFFFLKWLPGTYLEVIVRKIYNWNAVAHFNRRTNEIIIVLWHLFVYGCNSTSVT